jgi:type IV secretion system protein VirD4
MIMLDEFNRLGKMPIVLDSIETLRSYRANLAIVTQTIPALDEIYGENARRALQGNAGIKLYLTPSDEKTIEELSKAVGKTTKRVVTRSRSVGRNPFAGRSMSERTEETPLLPEDEARRMDLDDIVLVVDAQMPVRAKRIKYYEDRFFKQIFDKQTGDLPYPSAGDQMRGLQGQIKALEAKIGALEVPRAVSNEGSDDGGKRREEIDGLANEEQGAVSGEKASLDEYQAGAERVERFMEEAARR